MELGGGGLWLLHGGGSSREPPSVWIQPESQSQGDHSDLLPNPLLPTQTQPPTHTLGHAEESLPTWAEAHCTSIPTTRHVPKGAREDWARVLATTCTCVCDDHRNPREWLRLYILTRCVLPTKPRGKGYTAQSHAQVIRALIRRWRNGEEAQLWQEALKRRRTSPQTGRGKRKPSDREKTQQERNVERAAMLLQEGQYSRAAKALVSRGISQGSAEARQEMEDKHPTKEVPPTPEEVNSTPPITISSRQVYESIMGFKAGTAPGPSGMRAEHLKEAKAARTEGRGAASVLALTRLVNTMTAGNIPTEVTPYICGGNLFASIKKNGGHRPVAVGDILRRLTSKCVAYATSGRAAQILRPQQFGVGVRGGCEGVVHATRATLEDPDIPHDEKFTLQVDFDNGYNRIERSPMFAAVRKHFPEASHWVEASYGVETILNFGEGTIRSSTGTQQGDPLSSLLFCLTLQPVVQQLEDIPGLRQNSWFQDDGHLVGSRVALGEAMDIIRVEGQAWALPLG